MNKFDRTIRKLRISRRITQQVLANDPFDRMITKLQIKLLTKLLKQSMNITP